MIQTGLEFSSTTIVKNIYTALAMDSGDMNVFATPAMIALMENAAMNAVAKDLPKGFTTVGISINTTHIKASPLQETITAKAILTEIEGNKLTFDVVANDSKGIIGEGKHIRFIVDRQRFLEKLK